MNFNDNLPIYIQIMELIKGKIVRGEYEPGAKLLSVRDLATKLKVNPNTIQRSYQELENERIVVTKRGMGTFVTEDTKIIDETKKNMATEIIKQFLDSINAMGISREEVIKFLMEENISNKIDTNKEEK